MSKHPKTTTPSDKDLKRNPQIGSSKGTTMTGATAELEDLEGENTFEGDEENDANRHGGIDKGEKPDHRRSHH